MWGKIVKESIHNKLTERKNSKSRKKNITSYYVYDIYQNIKNNEEIKELCIGEKPNENKSQSKSNNKI